MGRRRGPFSPLLLVAAAGALGGLRAEGAPPPPQAAGGDAAQSPHGGERSHHAGAAGRREGPRRHRSTLGEHIGRSLRKAAAAGAAVATGRGLFSGHSRHRSGSGARPGTDIDAYYTQLEKLVKRQTGNLNSLSVHRWLGKKRSTLVHYRLVRSAIREYLPAAAKGDGRARVLDAGCGYGAGLMWLEQAEPRWELEGYTLSTAQHRFINSTLPPHRFKARLQSYDHLQGEFDAIYSIEALVHSKALQRTLAEWAKHLRPAGVVVIIDDFASSQVPDDDPDLNAFRRSWIAPSVTSAAALRRLAAAQGLTVVADRDLTKDYDIARLNYGNRIPSIKPSAPQAVHGAAVRQRLTVRGQLRYRMLVLRKGAPSPRHPA
eukprot:TRINITY_DN55121_c0_g1_i1.p1 TRINITY_DN55121_c0_g1~~TRINITY_DN55121_c0_g1_i1.p1  ORF type:complete len:385 (+),score=113.52 TRINITY_DN55121_c0_g1_i1:32-1156(+)